MPAGPLCRPAKCAMSAPSTERQASDLGHRRERDRDASPVPVPRSWPGCALPCLVALALCCRGGCPIERVRGMRAHAARSAIDTMMVRAGGITLAWRRKARAHMRSCC
eukprot:3688981-Prymnesium_polylepis.1